MKQMSLSATGFERKNERVCNCEFLDEMNLVVPLVELVSLIAPHTPQPAPKRRRQTCAVTRMLQLRLLRKAHGRSLQILATVNFTLSAKDLLIKLGSVLKTTLIATPISTKKKDGEHVPERHRARQGNTLQFRMKTDICSDADSGLANPAATGANAHDVTQSSEMPHGQQTGVIADSDYRGVEKREEIQAQNLDVNGQVVMMPGKRRALRKDPPIVDTFDNLEQTKTRIRAKLEHAFRVVKRQFGYVKVKYRGPARNTANLMTLFALSNLWMVHKGLLNMGCRQ